LASVPTACAAGERKALPPVTMTDINWLAAATTESQIPIHKVQVALKDQDKAIKL